MSLFGQPSAPPHAHTCECGELITSTASHAVHGLPIKTPAYHCSITHSLQGVVLVGGLATGHELDGGEATHLELLTQGAVGVCVDLRAEGRSWAWLGGGGQVATGAGSLWHVFVWLQQPRSCEATAPECCNPAE